MGLRGNGEKAVKETVRKPYPKAFYAVVIFACVLAIFPLISPSPVFTQVMIWIMWYAFLTIGWNIVGGFAGQLSFAHPAFAGIGAYVSSILFMHWGISPWLGMLAGGLVAVLVVATIGYPCFKLRGAYFAITSIALAEVLRIFIENTDSVFGIKVGGPMGLLLPLEGHAPTLYQFVNKDYFYYIILIFMLGGLLVTYLISRSKMGYYLSAIRNDVEAALSLGVDVAKYRLLAAAVSSFMAALAGTFYAQYVLYIHPTGIMGLHLAFEIVFIAIVGGRGTLLGPLLGAFVLVPVSELSRMYLGGGYSGAHLAVYGLLVMLVILFMPGGLSKFFESLYARFMKKRNVQVEGGMDSASAGD